MSVNTIKIFVGDFCSIFFRILIIVFLSLSIYMNNFDIYSILALFIIISASLSILISYRLCKKYDPYLKNIFIVSPDVHSQVISFFLPLPNSYLIKLKTTRSTLYSRFIVGKTKKILNIDGVEKIVKSKKFPKDIKIIDKLIVYLFLYSIIGFFVAGLFLLPRLLN